MNSDTTECSKSLETVRRLVKTDKREYDNNIILMMWLNSLPDNCALAGLPVIGIVFIDIIYNCTNTNIKAFPCIICYWQYYSM